MNLVQLEAVASALGRLLPHVTFVGGSTTFLLVDESAHHGVRQTEDVDVIIDVATKVEYHRFAKDLRALGFKEDIDGPICRWLFDAPFGQAKLDVMPDSVEILGFSNRWYKPAIETGTKVTLPGGLDIRLIAPEYFLATKFEAFLGRGKGDYFSHDMEDIVFVLENRKRIIFELMESPAGVRNYLSQRASELLCDDFLNVLPGLLNNPDSAHGIQNGLKIMAGWRP